MSKSNIMKQIENGSLSYSENQEEFKINKYNFKSEDRFVSISNFVTKLEVANASRINNGVASNVS